MVQDQGEVLGAFHFERPPICFLSRVCGCARMCVLFFFSGRVSLSPSLPPQCSMLTLVLLLLSENIEANMDVTYERVDHGVTQLTHASRYQVWTKLKGGCVYPGDWLSPSSCIIITHTDTHTHTHTHTHTYRPTHALTHSLTNSLSLSSEIGKEQGHVPAGDCCDCGGHSGRYPRANTHTQEQKLMLPLVSPVSSSQFLSLLSSSLLAQCLIFFFSPPFSLSVPHSRVHAFFFLCSPLHHTCTPPLTLTQNTATLMKTTPQPVKQMPCFVGCGQGVRFAFSFLFWK